MFNPATGQVTANVSFASQQETHAAIQAARVALPVWSETPSLQRARVLFRFKALLDAHIDELAGLITSEHGKVLADARGEVMRGIEVVEFACGIPHLLKGEFSDNAGRGIDCWSLRQPVGVCAGVTPFNFPAMVPLWMFPVAIACGNTFVLKPSEKDPSCGLRLAELRAEAGLPGGVLNVVNGDREAVDALLTDPDVGAISFVGSTSVARHVYETAARAGKRVQALGGAKNHMVVMPDADAKLAAQALMGAAYGSAGERCMAISVAVAVGDAGDRLIAELRPLIASLNVGPGTTAGVEMGPLVTREHLQRVRDYVDIGVKEGATPVVDGRTLQVPGHSDGFYRCDAVRSGRAADAHLSRGDFRTGAHRGSRAGSACRARARQRARIRQRHGNLHARRRRGARVLSRSAGWNGWRERTHSVPMAFHSFGGWKRSLFGDLQVHGPEGVRFYTRLKTVTSRWSAAPRSGSDYLMPTMK